MSVTSGTDRASSTAAPSSDRRMPAAVRGALVLSCRVLAYLGLGAAAYVGNPSLVVGAAALLLAGEGARGALSARRAPELGWLSPVRCSAALIFVAAVNAGERFALLAVGGFAAFVGLNLTGGALAGLVRRQRDLPLIPRGLNLGAVRIPKAPPPALSGRAANLLPLVDLTLPIGLALGVLLESWTVAVAVPSAGAGLRALAMLPLVRCAFAMQRLPLDRLRSAVRWALTEVNPRTVVYFGGHASELFRLESWLATFERLGEPVLVILRDRAAFAALGPTRLPCLYVADATELRRVVPPELALVLYVSLDANNADLRQRRGPRHVYLGHGDSDRPASTNPLLLGYDEVWVAGSVGRQRLRAAPPGSELGVEDHRIAEIGRAQLDELAAATPVPAADYPLLILYAPTLPDADSEVEQCSLATFGVDLVRWLMEEPDVCVVYRPHPRLALAPPAVRDAHRLILELLGKDARVRRPAAPMSVPRDELELATAPETMSHTEWLAALEVWSRKQLERARREQRHLYAPGPYFQLFACLAAADALVCDISTVLCDFLVTGKPYAVTNPGNNGAYVERHPTTGGGYIVAPDGCGLDDLLMAARGDGDALRSIRIALRERIVGPANPPALQRLRTQIRRLAPERPGAFIPAPAAAPSADARWKV